MGTKEKSNSKGITLIALIVTIIIMLILVGVALSMITGDSGIINRGENAAIEYNESSMKEKLQMAVFEAQMEYATSDVTFEQIAEQLINNGVIAEGSYDVANKQITTKDGYILKLVKEESGSWRAELVQNNIQSTLASNVGEITITPSTADWTNEDVEIEVTWPEEEHALNKEISIDGGTTYSAYTGKVSVSNNCTVIARMADTRGVAIKTATLVIDKIDKEAPTVTLAFSALNVTGTVGTVSMGVNGTVTSSDAGIGIDYSQCKYIINTSATPLGTSGTYNTGTIDTATTTISKTRTAGTYWLHVLVTDELGNSKEYISSNSVAVTGVINVAYSGSVKDATMPAGSYKLECWGAQGGSYSTYYGGKGGYSYGTINLPSETTLNAYVGGKGTDFTASTLLAGGFNGGGNAYTTSTNYNAAAGGGATDFRINSTSLYARVIVAGGGGRNWKL